MPFAIVCMREPGHERRSETAALLDASDGDAVLAKLGGHRTIGRRRERDHADLVSTRLLADREVERDALLAADAERREHVDDRQHVAKLADMASSWRARARRSRLRRGDPAVAE